jgi:hypothetical protein
LGSRRFLSWIEFFRRFVEVRKIIYRKSDTGISLHESSKRRKIENGVAR